MNFKLSASFYKQPYNSLVINCEIATFFSFFSPGEKGLLFIHNEYI